MLVETFNFTICSFQSSMAYFIRIHWWIACLLFEDVSDEMKKHTDHLTQSHFGETNDSKINRKQRHRKQCETRDDIDGVFLSNRVRWAHTGTHKETLTFGLSFFYHLEGSWLIPEIASFLELTSAREVNKNCCFKEESFFLMSIVPCLLNKEVCPLCWTTSSFFSHQRTLETTDRSCNSHS